MEEWNLILYVYIIYICTHGIIRNGHLTKIHAYSGLKDK